MARREFNRAVKTAARKRANGQCEGLLPSGLRCTTPLEDGRFDYDHVIADGLGGTPTLDNCACLCRACHKAKTANDVRIIAKAVRIVDRRQGTSTPRQKIAQRPKEPAAPQRRATTALSKTPPPRKRPLISSAGAN